MYSVTMPKLSDSMEVGKILQWRVKEGDEVHVGDVLAEIESDKAAMELECFHDGRIAKIAHGDDTEVAVGDVIAMIESEDESGVAEEAPEVEKKKESPPEEEPGPPVAEKKLPPPKVPAPPRQEGERIAVSPFARKLAAEHGLDLSQVSGSGPDGRIVARDVQEAVGGVKKPQPPLKKQVATRSQNIEPLAKSLLDRYGFDPEDVPGTGPNDQITVDDAIHALTGTTPVHIKPSADEELAPLEVGPDEADVEEAPFRLKTLARRVTASKHVIPHFYVTRGVEATKLLERKATLKESTGATVTHLIMLASIKTLGKHPEVNRSYDHGKVFNWKGIHLGLAIDTDEGLTVAVLHDAQELSLQDIVARSKDLVEKARAGKLSAAERAHATFTITNLGMFDVENFQPIINPPSSVTLAVSSALDTPVMHDGGLALGKVMRLTMSCDHRIIDGATAAAFLKDLKTALENPDSFLVKEREIQ